MPSPSRRRSLPWPSETPAPVPVPSTTRHKKLRDRQAQVDPQNSGSVHVAVRDRSQDIITDQSQVTAAETQCEVFSSNDVFSCFPTTDTTIPQHQFASLVWNSQLPQFTQFNLVNIYLLSATSMDQILFFPNVTNPTGTAGLIHAPVNDTWFGDRAILWNGSNQTFLFQWVITRNDVPLDGSASLQPIFTAVQTTFADFVVASMSSAAAASSQSAASASAASVASAASASQAALSAASSASVASASSAAAARHSGASGQVSGTGTGTSPTSASSEGAGNVQSGNGGSSFPHWAIAVIVVLGFLALLAGGVLTFLITRRLRNRRNSRLSHRGSMGSSTPMMQNREPQSPIVAAGGGFALTDAPHRPPSPENDGASTMSHGSEAAPFSGADAAVMADAFRAALRKPNFSDRPVEEGESPESDPSSTEPTTRAGEILDRELAEEGRDIRSVDSSRGVTVQSLQDTVQDQ